MKKRSSSRSWRPSDCSFATTSPCRLKLRATVLSAAANCVWSRGTRFTDILTKLGLGDATLLQTARVRRAWSAVRLYFQQAEQDRILTLFWVTASFGMSRLLYGNVTSCGFLAEVHPSDMVVSRVSRELRKRMLCVFNIWKVKNLQFQLTTVQKKRKLGDNLYTEETETDAHVGGCQKYGPLLGPRNTRCRLILRTQKGTIILTATPVCKDADTYLDKLYILMLAYAIAGAAPLAGVSDPTKLGAKSANFVEVPLDVVLANWFRAKRFAASVPVKHRLAWLQVRDTDKRSEWVTRFRESSQSMGVVVQQVMPRCALGCGGLDSWGE